jgi:hypothetical protein
MTIPETTKRNIRKTILRMRRVHLKTPVVLVACCYVNGLAQELYLGKNERGFRKYIERYMPKTFAGLRERSRLIGKKDDYCLHTLWGKVRNGLVHEIHCKSGSHIIGRGKTPVHLNIKDKRWPGMELVLCAPRFVDEFLESLDNI